MDNESIYLPDNFTTFLALSQQERDLRVKEAMKALSVVYIHTSPSGKSYVGQTYTLGDARWIQHRLSARNGRKTKFARALRKYDQDEDWSHAILWVSDDRGETNEMETHMIEKFDAVENGYNIKLGGEGGGRWSEECRKSLRGLNHYAARLVNVFNRDGVLVYENVVLSRLCDEYKIDQGGIHLTTKADLTKPTSTKNRHFHKGLCARYVEDGVPDFLNRNTSGDRNVIYYNIYNKDGVLIESEVGGLAQWCKLNGYNVGGLHRTINSDHTKPSTTMNPHYHRGIRAEYA